jgi:hypothetical protein
MRKLGILIIVATVGACAKRSADESQPATSAAEQTAAPDMPAPAQPSPPPAAEPAPAPGTLAAPKSGEDNDQTKKRDELKNEKQKAFSTVEEAEAALAQAKTELDTLLSPAGKAVALSSGDARCDKACKAFSSLQRAADGVCRLAGDDTPRCSKARGTVNENEKRVASCGCAKDDD